MPGNDGSPGARGLPGERGGPGAGGDKGPPVSCHFFCNMKLKLHDEEQFTDSSCSFDSRVMVGDQALQVFRE